ncbi:hypothetical protein EV137_2282 [Kribbella pratensis]|uniref:FCD domain-containing protein n=1 Tax=Kribbella pratensis TaxID=2512112 RepID=A0ABY2FP80_9ACTN|nr:hypothetical protein [Kribbella pratensis]TDW94954.1 hypothetical protein EV137_2282 [Kribbella pratensis]
MVGLPGLGKPPGSTDEDLNRTHNEHIALVDAIAAGDSAVTEPAARSLCGIRGART